MNVDGRFWWTLKYEEVYPKDYADGRSLHHGLGRSFDYYNQERNTRRWTSGRPLRYSWKD